MAQHNQYSLLIISIQYEEDSIPYSLSVAQTGKGSSVFNMQFQSLLWDGLWWEKAGKKRKAFSFITFAHMWNKYFLLPGAKGPL